MQSPHLQKTRKKNIFFSKSPRVVERNWNKTKKNMLGEEEEEEGRCVLSRRCLVGSSLRCCWCLDGRLFAARYERYQDGEGFVRNALRSDRYCAVCTPMRCEKAPRNNRDLYRSVCGGLEFPPATQWDEKRRDFRVDVRLPIPKEEALFWSKHFAAEWVAVQALSWKALVSLAISEVHVCDHASKMPTHLKNKSSLALALMRFRHDHALTHSFEE